MSAASNGETIIELKGVSKTYSRGKEDVHVLDNLDLTVRKGAFEAFMGPSGSGKSTLLNLIAGVDHASAGSVRVAGQELTRMGDGELAKFRSSNLGFIFQQYNLLPVLNAQDNVELPLLLTSLGSGERKKRAQTALRVVGLEDRMTHFPRQLSGGQEQRVAIARAIVSDPTLLVCYEPTGDLDRATAHEIMLLLQLLNRQHGKTIVMVTHDPKAAEYAQHSLHLDKGTLAPADGIAR
jgi:putative ABC transport system ATP-binding protein